MKLRVFRSDKGDCLLVVGSAGGRILSDGGMRQSFAASVAAHLEGEDLDLVCVSHVDDDHIAGVLQLLDNAMAWKVFKFHKDKGEDVNPPDVPQPPTIKRVWHNAFHDQIGKNAADAADLLSAIVPLLANVNDEELRNAAIDSQSIVNSNKQAIQVSQRLRPEQLNIPLNENDKLIMVRDGQHGFSLRGLDVRVIAPFEEDLEVFKEAWNEWLRKNKEQVKKLRAKAKEDAQSLEDDVDRLMLPIELSPGELGDRKAVTPPNLASIMLFVKDGNDTLLLTGDGHADDALKGLKHINALKPDGTLHVNILKVPHHGS